MASGAEIIYTDSIYTSAIVELERAADFVTDFAKLYECIPDEFVSLLAKALRGRADKLRENERMYGG